MAHDVITIPASIVVSKFAFSTGEMVISDF
jgi:hypothetical protein